MTKGSWEQAQAHRLALDEMGQSLERRSLPKLTQEETEALNRPVCVREMESIIHHLPTQSPGLRWVAPDGCAGELYQSRGSCALCSLPECSFREASPDSQSRRRLQESAGHRMLRAEVVGGVKARAHPIRQRRKNWTPPPGGLHPSCARLGLAFKSSRKPSGPQAKGEKISRSDQ